MTLTELVIASHNAGKVREIADLLHPFAIAVSSASDAHIPEPEETGDTFEANAGLKAEHAAQHCGKASLADDSGLVVPALGGDPGIYSARWAGPNKDFAMAMKKIEDGLREHAQEPTGSDAYFVCVLALAAPAQETHFFRGEVHGTLTFPPRGDHGFGYDPIFIPNAQIDNRCETFAEMASSLKQTISHRAVAFAKFIAYIQSQHAA